MKKNLIVALALVFVLGIAGTAFAAANPFVDVPAKHWAYDAVTKLAQAGILDGYGDGTYRGERLATRYEMAQATAKAMARADKADAQMKALIDKLAVEFAAELNNLGVRVAKLEKNASTIKFWGEARLRYQSNPTAKLDGENTTSRFQQRMRVYAKADLNDKAAFYGRLAAEWTANNNNGTTQNSDIFWDYGYFQWTFNPNFNVAVGRNQIIGAYNVFWTNGGYDGVVFNYKNEKFNGKLAYGDAGNYKADNGAVTGTKTGVGLQKEILLVDANYAFTKKFSMNAGLYNSSKSASYPYQIWTIGLRSQLNDDFLFTAGYFSNSAKEAKALNADKKPDAWYAELWYKGAQKTKVGSWGLSVNYRNVKPFAIDWQHASGVFGNSISTQSYSSSTGYSDYGVKGWGFQANYTLSKNAILTATYETLNRNAAGDTRKIKPFYYLQMNVYF
jgi:hypothetical protein